MYKYNSSISFGGFKEIDEFSDKEIDDWFIINCSKKERGDSNVWIPLNDGVYDGGNTQEDFAKTVNAVRNEIHSDNKVFIHCAMGQSRSVSILATAISAENDISFEDVLDELMTIRGIFTKPSPSLISKSKIYLRHTK